MDFITQVTWVLMGVLIVVVVPTFIMHRMMSQRSRLLVQGAFLLTLGSAALFLSLFAARIATTHAGSSEVEMADAEADGWPAALRRLARAMPPEHPAGNGGPVDLL